MNVRKISKPYWNSGKKDALAIVMPKVVREALNVDEESYVAWNLSVNDNDQLVVTVDKV